MANSNRHAYVVPLVMEPHPDPETTRLSIVRVNAYTCVVATEDWQGYDRAIYIQPDTVVPDTPEFAFLKRNNSARKKLDEAYAAVAPGGEAMAPEEYIVRLAAIEEAEAKNTDRLRITAVRLRGVQSFGMLWPVPPDSPLQVGDDAYEMMGFKRFEPPMPVGETGEMDSAPDLPWLHEYDVDNYYNWPNVFQEDEEVVFTEKLDGTNARFVWGLDRVTGEYRMFIGGKTEWKRDTPHSLYWVALRANPWIVEFCKAHPDWMVYGEVFGFQKLKYGVKPNQPNRIRVFDVLAVDHFLDYDDFEVLFTEAQRVPVVYRGKWNPEEILKLSLGKSTLAEHLREGVVGGPVKERNDISLGRVKVKIVSFDLLSKR